MDKTILLQLIARGESSSLDFKRELNLESARDKAEFVKDLIAIANSVDEVGHLVIGVKDDGSVVGTKRLPEERIQQIARRYIEPMPKLFIDHNAVEIEGREVLLALVSVQPTSLPHKVRKAIERLEQDEVFVRDGTVVSRAGPDEVLRLYRKQNLASDLGAYLHAARRISNSRITDTRSGPIRPQLISILHWICFLNAQTLVVNITASLRIKTNSYWLQKQFLKISKTH